MARSRASWRVRSSWSPTTCTRSSRGSGPVASRSWSPPNRRPIPSAPASRHSIPTVTGSSSVSGPDAQAATADHQPAEPDLERSGSAAAYSAVPSTDLLLVPDLDGVAGPQRLVDGSFDVLGDEDRRRPGPWQDATRRSSALQLQRSP